LRLNDIYKQIVDTGMKNDPRPRKEVAKALASAKKEYRSLKGARKRSFDTDSLFNPYSDTRILYGDRDKDVMTLMVGVDIDATELLVADRFRQMGRPVDLVMSHHPGGRALTDLYRVMGIQTDLLKRLGVAKEAAEEMMGERIAEVARGLHSRNCMRTIDMAGILDIPFMCAHTVADNMVSTFLQGLMDRKNPKTLGAVMNILEGIDEYKEGIASGIGPMIFVGDKKKPAGRIYVDMTGGTEGSKRIFGRLSQIGVKTLVCMHLSEAHYKEAKKERLNVIIAGHIPSDNVGLNLMLDELVKKESLTIVPCSGFRRFSRI